MSDILVTGSRLVLCDKCQNKMYPSRLSFGSHKYIYLYFVCCECKKTTLLFLVDDNTMKPVYGHLMNIDELVSYLKLKKSYIYKLVCENKIPVIKKDNNRLYFNQQEIDKWNADKRKMV